MPLVITTELLATTFQMSTFYLEHTYAVRSTRTWVSFKYGINSKNPLDPWINKISMLSHLCTRTSMLLHILVVCLPIQTDKFQYNQNCYSAVVGLKGQGEHQRKDICRSILSVPDCYRRFETK